MIWLRNHCVRSRYGLSKTASGVPSSTIGVSLCIFAFPLTLCRYAVASSSIPPAAETQISIAS